MAEIPTKPYLIRALYEWCTDNGYRPYLAVSVDERTLVPRESVSNGEIVLNISAAATNGLTLGNDTIEFEARFSGVARRVSIPVDNVSAIFAQENGHGMAFEVAKERAPAPSGADEPGAKGASEGVASSPLAEAGDGPGDAASAPRPARRQPKLEAVPESGGAVAKSPRRRSRPQAVPSLPASDAGDAPAPQAHGGLAGAPSSPGRESDPEAGNGPDGDEPGPGAPPAGKRHLTRVK